MLLFSDGRARRAVVRNNEAIRETGENVRMQSREGIVAEPQLLTMWEVRQHLRQEASRTPLEEAALAELDKATFLGCFEDSELVEELIEMLPQVFGRREDACVFMDTLPVTVDQAQSWFGVSGEQARVVAGLGRQVRGEQAQ